MKNRKTHARFLIALASIFFVFLAFTVIGQSTYYVDDDTGDDTRTPAEAQNPATPWLTIQHAINSVSSGDTVMVMPGTYPEQIVVDKSITLRGATYQINKNGYPVPANYAWDDNIESIIDCPPTVNILIAYDNISDFTLEGFVIQALYRDNNNQNNLIRLAAITASIDNAIIRNNIIGPNTNIIDQDGTKGRMNIDIYITWADFGMTNSLITGNKIFDSKGNGDNIFIFGAYAAYAYSNTGPMHGTYIEDNEIYGSHRSGIEVAGGIDGLVIQNNKIYNNSGYVTDPPEMLKYGNGILFIRGSSDLVSGSAAEGPKNVIIRQNEIYDNQKNGIYLGPIDSALTIVDNRIVNNGWDAIRLDLEEHYYDGNANWNPVYDKTFDIVANFNNTFDNDTSGVKVVGAPTNGFVFDGLYNFWGEKDGPGGQGPGSGNGVSDYVDYGPWIDDEIEDYRNLKTTSPTSVGSAGGDISVTITSVPNDDNFLDVYQTGLFSDLPEVGEDFVTNLTGCIFRFKLLWGVVETGDVTADLVFDYSNQIGIADPTDIVILRRDNVLDPDWEYVPETSRDDVNRTITLAGTSVYGEYVLGFKGKFWTAGNSNDDWNDPFNWFSVGVPTDNDNIIIVGGLPFYPEANSGPLARAKNIYVEPFAHITVPVGNGLTVYGDLLNNGMITVLSDNTGASGTFINNGLLQGNGYFNFNRDMTGTGVLGDPAGWHYISSPLDGMSCHHIFDYWINAWNESQNTWYNYSPSGIPCVAGPDNPFETFRGYSIKRDLDYQCGAVNPPTGNIVEFTGFITDLHSGAYSVDLTGTAFSGGSLDNWNFIGNPYPASIDYEYWKNNIPGSIPAEVDDAIYFWDDNALIYRSWINGVGYTQYIPPTQGFYMHVNTPGTWTVNIDNAARSHSGASEYFKSDVDNLLVLEASGNGYSDETYIRFMDNASQAFEGNEDAYKLLSEVKFVPQLYTYAGSEKLSINTLPSAGSMELAFQSGQSGYYTLSVAESGIGYVVLEDIKTGEFGNIEDQEYQFFYSQGDDPNRFRLHFGTGTGLANGKSVSVFSANGNLYINNTGSSGTAIVYDMMGQEITGREVSPGVNTIKLGNHNGYYLVKVNTTEVSETFKFLLR